GHRALRLDRSLHDEEDLPALLVPGRDETVERRGSLRDEREVDQVALPRRAPVVVVDGDAGDRAALDRVLAVDEDLARPARGPLQGEVVALPRSVRAARL